MTKEGVVPEESHAAGGCSVGCIINCYNSSACILLADSAWQLTLKLSQLSLDLLGMGVALLIRSAQQQVGHP